MSGHLPKRKNGQGYITKLPNGKYRMRKQHGFMDNGNARILTVTGTSETACLRLMKKRELEFDEISSDSRSQTMTLTELCYRHLADNRSKKDYIKPRSADRRETTIKNQISPYSIGSLQAHSVTAQDIQYYLENMISNSGLAISTIKKAYDVINAAFKWAISHRYIRYNPCVEIHEYYIKRFRNLDDLEHLECEIAVLTDEEIKVIREYVKSLKDNSDLVSYRVGLSMLLLLKIGIRESELCALRKHHWNRDLSTLAIKNARNTIRNQNTEKGRKTIVVESSLKNKAYRTIGITREANRLLEEICRISDDNTSDDHILINSRGNPYNSTTYGNAINKIYAKAGLCNISGAHILRRTCATNMYEDGARIEDIAAYLGDSKEVIEKHYIFLKTTIKQGDKVLNVIPVPFKYYTPREDN